MLICLQAHAKGLEVTAQIDPLLPPLVKADAGRVRQILLNLAGNAVKFTRQGEVALELKVLEATSRGTRVRCEVRDTGIGMTEEQRAQTAKAMDLMVDTTVSPEQAQAILHGWRTAMDELITSKRRNPGEDIASDLIAARDDENGSQLTDTEQETNGLLTADRRPKLDPERVRLITGRPSRAVPSELLDALIMQEVELRRRERGQE